MSPAPGRMRHAQTLPEMLQLGLQLLPLSRQLLLLSHHLPHGVRDLFSSQAEVVVLGFQLPALTVQHLTLDILLFDVFLIRFEDGLDPVPPVTQRLFFFLVFLITVIGVFLGGEFGAWRAVSPDRGWTVQTVGLECGVCVGVCAAARAALQLRDVVVHRGVHGVVGLGDGRGATFVLLQCFLSGLQHRLVELQGELLGRESLPRLGPAVQVASAVFRVRAVQQDGGLLVEDYVASSVFIRV